jgi:2-polyprenyl-3-methyl-5-hydroxy-6-metoxy-1,4-benzoquinol methylase
VADGKSFVPSSDAFGATIGRLLRCDDCGHAALESPPATEVFEGAYSDAADAVSLREERGQVRTSARDLALVEQHHSPGRLLDVGCWTGSLLVAANERGWTAEGIEPSRWAVERAQQRGASVRLGTVDDVDLDPGAYDAIVACDVVEHVVDPLALLARFDAALAPGGVLFLTVPDAGSVAARALGRRWWSVLPMHVQYFTRASMARLLDRAGFEIAVVRTHAKAFSAEYYAERLAAFVPVGGGLVTGASTRLHLEDRMVAPDLRDRMAVVARRR